MILCEDRMMKKQLNLRQFTRVPVNMEVEVVAGKSTILGHLTKDVSLNGLFLSSEEKLPAGTDCHLTIFLGGRDSQQRIELRGKVVRVEERGMAFAFQEIMGSDSFAHLRTLILYNSKEARRVEKEFKAHLGIRRRK
jgi:hypothetical protein